MLLLFPQTEKTKIVQNEWVNLLKPSFRVRKSILSFSPYLYTGSLISLLQCFPHFVLPMSWYYSSPICLCSKQQITVWLFLSSGQPNVCFLFRLSASLPHCPHLLIVFASVCPLLFMECKTAGVQRTSLELQCPQPSVPVAAKRLWKGLVRDRKPSVTSAMPPSLHWILSAVPVWLTLLCEDEAMTEWPAYK